VSSTARYITIVANATWDSRFANGLPGLSTAFADRSPIIVITSSPPLRDAESNCLQGFLDQALVANPITKFSHRITVAEEIPRLVSHAYRLAISGPSGKQIKSLANILPLVQSVLITSRSCAAGFSNRYSFSTGGAGPDCLGFDSITAAISSWPSCERYSRGSFTLAGS
jgi:hypothetical protein